MKINEIINLMLKVWALSILTYFVYLYGEQLNFEKSRQSSQIGRYVEVDYPNELGYNKVLDTATGYMHVK